VQAGAQLEAAVRDAVRDALAAGGAEVELTPALDFRRELDIDSITLLSVIFALEEKLGVDMFQYAERLADATRLADLIAIAADATAARQATQ
jgi:acyl carrier protein